MRRIIIFLLLIISIRPVFAESPEARAGKNLHYHMLARYSKLEKLYRQPSLWGGLSDSPKVTIFVTIADWKKLTSKEQDLLATYAASLINLMRSHPYNTGVDEDAPSASLVRQNALKMNANSWQIMAGRLSSDGRDILADSTVRSGDMSAKISKQSSTSPTRAPQAVPVKPVSKRDSDILARKLAVATYYEQILKQEYTMAVVSVQGNKGEILQVSLIRVTDDRCNSILQSGLYNEAKKAKFRRIVFVDANQEKTSFEIK